jgi:glycosyltransferase involved in cell wall biosynthesis
MQIDKNRKEIERPSISVVIPCWNEYAHISHCAEALLHGTLPDIEVIIVDGQSTDGTRRIIAALAEGDPRVRVLDNPDRTTPAALNIGIANAIGEFVAILGAHSVPSVDWLESNLSALKRNPNVVGVGGVLETIGNTRMGRVGAAVLQSRFGVGNVRFRIGGPPGLVDTIVFGCYRRRAFQYGLFDPELVTNQDDEFNTRLRAEGERLYFDPSIHSRYYSRSSWSRLIRQYWRYGRFKPEVFRKAGAIGSARQIIPSLWVAFLGFALCLGPMFSVIRYGTFFVVATYLSLAAMAAIASADLTPSERFLFVPVAASVHLAYGLGMWCGTFKSAFRRGTMRVNC